MSGADKTVVAVKVLHSVHVCITFRVPGTGRYQGLGVSLTYSSRLPVNKSVHTVKQDVSVVVTHVEKNYAFLKVCFFSTCVFWTKSTHSESYFTKSKNSGLLFD